MTSCKDPPDISIQNNLPTDKRQSSFFIFQKHDINLEEIKPLADAVAKNLKRYGWEEKPKIFFKLCDYGIIITHQTDNKNRVSIIIFDMFESSKTNFKTLDIVYKGKIIDSKKTKKTELIDTLMADFVY